MISPVGLILERCVLEFRGKDVVRFLNGQLSNDVRKLQPGAAMHACVMTAKGRMNAEVWLTKVGDAIRVDGPAGLGEELLGRFERYIISDDVTVEDATEKWVLLHILGQSGEIQSRRFAEEGCDVWQSRGEPVADLPLLSPAEIESLRVERGIPAWGAELQETTIPVEAGLDRDGIDYHKGCYIGQEVISRIKSVGHVNRVLIRLRGEKDSTLSPGTELFAENALVGTVTSATRSLDLENVAALAYVKRTFSTPGTLLQSGSPSGEAHAVLALHS